MAYSIGFDIFANDKASATFDKLGGKVGDTGDKFSKFSGAAKLAAAAAGVAIVKFAGDSVAAYTDAEAQQRKLTDAYGRFPALADVSIKSLKDLAQAQQSKTKFDGDAVAAAMGSLASYKLTGAQLKELTPLMLDYAQKTGKDLPTAATDLGKAVLGSGKALKGIGLNFKDAGSESKNFDQLVGGLRTQVGGFAEQEGKSAEGRAEILKNKFGDLQESVGAKLTPALSKLADAGIVVVDWLEKNQPVAIAVASAVGVLTVATWAMNSALFANPIGLVVVALVGLGVALVAAYQKSETFRNIVDVSLKAIGAAWQWLWNSILAPVIRFILNGFGSITDGIAKMLDILSNIPGFEWAKTAADKMKGAAEKARDLAAGIRDIPDVKTITVNWVENGRTVGGSTGPSARAAGGPVTAGRPYIVGEHRPELFVPNVSGTILPSVPNDRISAMAGAGNGSTSADIKNLADRMDAALDRQARAIQTMRRQYA